MTLDRRDFIKSAAIAAGAATGTLIPLSGRAASAVEAAAPTPSPSIFVVHGDDVEKMLLVGIEKFGGWGSLVKKGMKVTIKANAAWASLPEQGGNTSPKLVGACVAACKAAGAAKVTVPENTCSDAKKSFAMSGIEASVKNAGGEIVSLEDKRQFREVTLKNAKSLSETEVAIDVLDADLLINLPVAKSHGSCKITCSMKNWMGSVKQRKTWHLKGIDQCVADINTLIKPNLIIVDATRIMTTEGPQGPGVMAYPKQLIFGKDPVAVDAYAATLFNLKPFDVPHIKMAHDMNIGIGDLKKIQITHIDAV
jgi:uncharacterized protein (DUF362 family)